MKRFIADNKTISGIFISVHEEKNSIIDFFSNFILEIANKII